MSKPELPPLAGTVWDRLYTAEQMREFYEAGRKAGRKETAEARTTRDAIFANLVCDPELGVFQRLKSVGRAKAGVVGSRRPNGYITVAACGQNFFAHRLVWLWVHGVWPTKHIDHINGDPSDNRISNLREVTASVNMQNLRKAKVGTVSGMLGVSAKRGLWVAQIRHGGQNKFLGLFSTPEAAHTAYLDAKRRLHEGCTL